MTNDLRLPEAPLRGIRLVVCDLDGTALTEEKEFSPRLRRAFARLRLEGTACTIASARTPMMLGVFCAQAGVQNTPVIAQEGGEIIDWSSGERLYSRPIEPDIAPAVMEYCHGAGLDYTIYTSRSCYLRRDTRRLWRFEKYSAQARACGLPPVPTQVYEETTPQAINAEGVLRVFVDNPPEEDKACLLEFLRAYPGLRTDCSENRSVTVMPAEVSKGNALKALAETLGLAPEEICCFGDWYNDLGMLASFPNSVAMQNGAPEVKAAAAYVTKPNTEDGVAYFIERFILGEK